MTSNTCEPNRLIHEKSPYLLQHAYNPVNWYPWTDEAFVKAKAENKPVFLSIGYSTCHWCHVMAHESFEDAEVAEILNREYVAIKVDREERPDIDEVYMAVCQALTGQGGWPLTVLMTSEKEPFFAGTYFPKDTRWGRPGLKEILNQITAHWRKEKDQITASAKKVVQAIQHQWRIEPAGRHLHEAVLHDAYFALQTSFDEDFGGFSDPPKFPVPHQLLFLLRYWRHTGKEDARDMAIHTLKKMAKGGIYDHIGYGFSRYATDREWLVPHFEKMLYDNALLAYVYTEAWQATKEPGFKGIAQEIFSYVARQMTAPEGAFYAAEDADSEGVEGKFYLWRPEEVREVLGEEKGGRLCRYYDITEGGNFEDSMSIPNLIHQDEETFAAREGLAPEVWEKEFHVCRAALYAHREKRVPPHKDDKILTSWNALMIVALAKGAFVFAEEKYLRMAEKAYDFIQRHLRREDGRLLARYRDGEAAYPAYLDDYAYLSWGLLELYQASGKTEYLKVAVRMTQEIVHLFWDEREGGFYLNGKDAEALFVRPKGAYDGALPSGNAVALYCLLQLARLTGDVEMERVAEKQSQAFAASIETQPVSFTMWMAALMQAFWPTKEVVIAGHPEHEDTQQMVAAYRSGYWPEAFLIYHPDGAAGREIESWVPAVHEQRAIDRKATAYVCEQFSCREPTTEPEKMKRLLLTLYHSPDEM